MSADSMVPAYGAALLKMTIALLVLCATAYLLVRWMARRDGRGPLRGRTRIPLQVVARCALDHRRALYLVEAAGRYLLLGAGDGPVTKLMEFDGADVTAGAALAPTGFLATLLGKPSRPEASAPGAIRPDAGPPSDPERPA